MMQALTLHTPGDPSVLTVGNMPIPQPGPHDVRVRLQAASLNPVDYKLIGRGLLEWVYPFIPGLDGAGIIDSVGESVTDWKAGDRVAFHANFRKPGVFADYTVVPHHILARIPDTVSYAEAASLPCAGLTALNALRRLKLNTGDSLLILGGAGGVGTFAIQLAKLHGLTVFTTASARNHTLLHNLGADHMIDYTQTDVLQEIEKLTEGQKVRGVFDTVGSASYPDPFQYLGFEGSLVSIVDNPAIPSDFNLRSLSWHAFMLGSSYMHGSITDQKRLLSTSLEELMQLVAEKKLHNQISQHIKWQDIPSGLEQLKTGRVQGKIVAEWAA